MPGWDKCQWVKDCHQIWAATMCFLFRCHSGRQQPFLLRWHFDSNTLLFFLKKMSWTININWYYNTLLISYEQSLQWNCTSVQEKKCQNTDLLRGASYISKWWQSLGLLATQGKYDVWNVSIHSKLHLGFDSEIW